MKKAAGKGAVLALAVASIGATAFAGTALAQRPSDESIKSHIQESLLVDPRVDTADVQVEVNDGYVKLVGSVRDLAAKEYAVSEAEKIAGVEGVEDETVVSAPWRPDADIRQDVRHRLVDHSRIHSDGIGVSCVSGEVTLTGEVEAYVEKKLATDLASEVRGVRKVTNDMTVRYSSSRSDAEILDDVKSALQLDVYLTALPIRVRVDQGNVTLEGAVGSWYTKRRAEDAVRWLPGVREVRNELEVVWTENQGMRTAEPMVADDVLANRVTAQLLRDSRIDAAKVDVRAVAGVVTLSGNVPSAYERRIAFEDAKDTVGVGWVTDNLVVGAVPRSDEAIATDVLWELGDDYLLAGTDLEAKVKDGVVTLEGKLHSYFQKEHATDVADRIPGVKRVVSDIEVVTSARSDKEIADAVNDRLKWNWRTYWVHDQIHATAEDGTVTLTGTVKSWAERSAAARIAYDTPGVWRVYDHIHVEGYPYDWEEWNEVPMSVD